MRYLKAWSYACAPKIMIIVILIRFYDLRGTNFDSFRLKKYTLSDIRKQKNCQSNEKKLSKQLKIASLFWAFTSCGKYQCFKKCKMFCGSIFIYQWKPNILITSCSTDMNRGSKQTNIHHFGHFCHQKKENFHKSKKNIY